MCNKCGNGNLPDGLKTSERDSFITHDFCTCDAGYDLAESHPQYGGTRFYNKPLPEKLTIDTCGELLRYSSRTDADHVWDIGQSVFVSDYEGNLYQGVIDKHSWAHNMRFVEGYYPTYYVRGAEILTNTTELWLKPKEK